MNVTVTASDLGTARSEGTVIMITGTGPDGQRVTFAGDWRPMDVLLGGAAQLGEITAAVEPYQVLGASLIDQAPSFRPME